LLQGADRVRRTGGFVAILRAREGLLDGERAHPADHHGCRGHVSLTTTSASAHTAATHAAATHATHSTASATATAPTAPTHAGAAIAHPAVRVLAAATVTFPFNCKAVAPGRFLQDLLDFLFVPLVELFRLPKVGRQQRAAGTRG